MATTIADLLVTFSATGIAGIEKDAARLSRSIKRTAGDFTDVGQSLTLFGGAGVAAFGLIAKEAIDFESAFTGVRKTLDATPEQFREIEESIRELSREIPIAANELARIAETGGQLGILPENVIEFTRVIAELGVASNLTGEEGATMLARFANITQAKPEEYRSLASIIVDLGNNSATTERDIAAMALRIAGAATTAGIAKEDVLGISAALSSVGVEAEAGGTAFSKLIINIAQAVAQGGEDLEKFARVAGQTSEEFRQSFQQNGAQALQSFIQGLDRIQTSGGNVFDTLETLGITEIRLRDAVLRSTQASDLFSESLSRSSGELRNQNALTEEAERRFATTQSQLRLLVADIRDLAIEIGSTVLPALREFIADIRPILSSISQWVGDNKELVGSLALVGGAISGIALAGGGTLIFIGQLFSAWGSLVGILPAVASGIAALGTAATGPIGLAALGIGALAAGFVTFKERQKNAVDKDTLKSVAELREELENLGVEVEDQGSGETWVNYSNRVVDAAKAHGVLIVKMREQRGEFRNTEEALSAQDEALRKINERVRQSESAFSKTFSASGRLGEVADAVFEFTKKTEDATKAVEDSTEVVRQAEPELGRMEDAYRELDREARAAALGVDTFDQAVSGLSLDPVAQIMREVSREMAGIADQGPVLAASVSDSARAVSEVAAQANDAAVSLDLMNAAAVEAAEQGAADLSSVFPDIVDTIEEVSTKTKENAAEWRSWQRQVSTILTDASRDIAAALVSFKPGEILDVFRKDLPQAVARFVTEFLIGKLFRALGDLVSDILPGVKNAIGAVFNVGGGAASAAGGAAGSAGRAAGSVAGAAASGTTALVTGFAQLGAQIFGLFQNARQETTLNAIEENTRKSSLFLGGRDDGGVLGQLFKVNEGISFGPGTKATELLKDKFVFFSDATLAKLDQWSPGVNRLGEIAENVSKIANESRQLEVRLRVNASGDELAELIGRRIVLESAVAV